MWFLATGFILLSWHFFRVRCVLYKHFIVWLYHIFPSIHWWMFGWSPLVIMSNELFVWAYAFPSLWLTAMGGGVDRWFMYLAFSKLHFILVHHFIFHPAVCEGSNSPNSLRRFIIVLFIFLKCKHLSVYCLIACLYLFVWIFWGNLLCSPDWSGLTVWARLALNIPS